MDARAGAWCPVCGPGQEGGLREALIGSNAAASEPVKRTRVRVQAKRTFSHHVGAIGPTGGQL